MPGMNLGEDRMNCLKEETGLFVREEFYMVCAFPINEAISSSNPELQRIYFCPVASLVVFWFVLARWLRMLPFTTAELVR